MVKDLDIYRRVGRAVAHDEVIPFKVQSGNLIVNRKKSQIVNKKVLLTLVKVSTVQSSVGIAIN